MNDKLEGQIHEIEMSNENAKKLVQMGAALQRLTNNRDFKKVVLEGFFKEEPVRLTELLAGPSQQSPEAQAELLGQLKAISGLNQYFVKVQMVANMSQDAITSNEEVLEQIAQAEADGVEFTVE